MAASDTGMVCPVGGSDCWAGFGTYCWDHDCRLVPPEELDNVPTAVVKQAAGSGQAIALPLVLILPLPPSANRYWRHTSQGPKLSEDARQYRDACRTAAVAQCGEGLIEDRVEVRVDVYRDLRGDLMNHEKQLMDALQGAVIEDDKQVWRCTLVRHLDRDDPRVEVHMQAYD